MSEQVNRFLEIGPPSASPTLVDGDGLAPEGIGGWLILPAIGLVLGSVLSVVGIVLLVGMSPSVPREYRGIFALNVLIDFGLTVFLIYAATRFFGKKRDTPRVMITFLIVRVIANGLLLVISLVAGADSFVIGCAATMVKGAVSGMIWIPYFWVSQRVKRTFVAP